MKNKASIYFLIFLLFGCDSKKDSNSSFVNQNLDSLIVSSFNKGDDESYVECSILLDYYNDKEKLFFYSMVYGNKFNNPYAYFNSYLGLNKDSLQEIKSSIISDDPVTKSFSLYFLLRAHETLTKSDSVEIKESIKNEIIKNFNSTEGLPNSEDFLLMELKKWKK
ncbi:MAG: hypothetical protein IPH28_21700 [Cytophagaceae bacterium]|nr:hypothetical protein [Cytophagaceae bacterium]MBK9933656.1 hypothetical protein [Cytophagaceae bacterium]MBL0302631.1 hypothetical protein [Cytophagaceae bacterium]MBL0325455.1 hypothetical protein [Cytophagaceae bacterium]